MEDTEDNRRRYFALLSTVFMTSMFAATDGIVGAPIDGDAGSSPRLGIVGCMSLVLASDVMDVFVTSWEWTPCAWCAWANRRSSISTKCWKGSKAKFSIVTTPAFDYHCNVVLAYPSDLCWRLSVDFTRCCLLDVEESFRKNQRCPPHLSTPVLSVECVWGICYWSARAFLWHSFFHGALIEFSVKICLSIVR